MKVFFRKHKIIILYNVITLLVLVSVSGMIYVSEFNRYEKLYDDFAEGIVNQSVVVFDEWINNQIELMHSLSDNQHIINVCLEPTSENVAKAKGFIESQHTASKYYHMITLSLSNEKNRLFTLNTVYIDSVNGVRFGEPIFQQIDFNRFVMNKIPVISTQFNSGLWQKNVIEIGVPIIVNNEVVGIVNGTLLVDVFGESYLSNTIFGETGFLALLEYDGKIIAHKDKKDLIKLFTANPELYESVKSTIGERFRVGEKNFYDVFLGVKKRYYAEIINHQYFEDFTFHLVYGQDYDEIFGSLKPLRQLLVLMIITFLALSSFIFKLTTSFNRQRVITDEIVEKNKLLEDKVKIREIELNTKIQLDSMTKIFNHNYIFKFVKERIQENDLSLSAFMIDLDYFKKINDQFGHQIGDEVIMRVVSDINMILKEHMVFGRYGGEEFLVVNYKIPIDELKFAELLRQTIENIEINNEEVKVTASIGVVRWNRHNINEFIKEVDDAVYQAKALGRNCVYVAD